MKGGKRNPSRLLKKYIFRIIDSVDHRISINLKQRILTVGLWGLGLAIYGFYISWMINTKNGPIDFLTFLRIGNLLNTHQEVYITNSYYPMPYVWIFGFLSAIPREISVVLWFVLPVLFAMYITKWNPWVLFFGPLLSHFIGGQSAIFGMIGMWGFRKFQAENTLTAGILLGLVAFKPQLLIVPLLYALYTWVLFIYKHRSFPKQAIGFAITTLIIYVPTFISDPTWVSRWLSSPRPLFARAVSALIPRVLLESINQSINQSIYPFLRNRHPGCMCYCSDTLEG